MELWRRKAIYWLIIILLLLLIFFLVVQLSPFIAKFFVVFKALLLPIGLSALLTYFLHPFVNQLEYVGVPRTVAVLLVFFVIIFSLVFLFTTGLPAFITQIEEALKHIPSQVKELKSMSNQVQIQVNSLPNPIRSQMWEWMLQLEKTSENALEQVGELAVFLFRSAFSFMIVPFLVFYLLKDYELIQKAAWYVTPRKWRTSLIRYVKELDVTFGRFIRGQLLVSCAVAIIATLSLWLIGVPYPIVLGLFIGVADLIPYFGAFIGAIPAIVIALLQSWQLALITVVIIFILQQLEGNLLGPIIVGKSLALHPLAMIIALLIGIETFGVIGLIVAVPLLAIGKVTLVHIRQHLLND